MKKAMFFLSANSLFLFSFLLLSPIGSFGKDTIETAGDIVLVIIPSSVYATTFFKDDEAGRFQFYKSFFTNLGVTFALKYAINKPRPENNGNYSFPSGHTSISFQSATFLHKRYGWEYGIPAYMAAGFVGWSRIESNQHDWADVAAGAALGILCGYYFTQPFDGVVLSPVLGDGSYGLLISMVW